MVGFDAQRGWGLVRADNGEELAFHCTAVADGSRHIEVGASVVFVVVPGRLGRFEARQLVVVDHGARS